MSSKPIRRAVLTLLLTALAVMVVAALARVGVAGDLVRVVERPRGFLQSRSDPRVYYEPGAEAAAGVVVSSMPGAVSRVVAALGPFPGPVRVYVCASVTSFARHTGNRRAGGNTTAGNRVFISPKPENTPQRLPALLTHELAHLDLHEHVGLVQIARLPVWFDEGLATWVAAGAGAEGVSADEAARAIRAGRQLRPVGSVSLFNRDVPSRYGLQAHLFYRQASMFVDYLHSADAAAFRGFLGRVEVGERVGQAFERAYGRTLESAWASFTAGLAVHGQPDSGS